MAVGARAWGAYYTCRTVAAYLAEWAIRGAGERVLEPSFGDGVFLDVALARMTRLGGTNRNLFGVELREEAFSQYVVKNALRESNGFRTDFLSLDSFPVDVVIGNPPYVRLRHAPKSGRDSALAAAERLGVRMVPSGSLWMAFVLHATSFLTLGGRIAFVLPYEMTYVKYALPLWRYLATHFGHLRMVRTREDLFPENEEETVLLMADEFGRSTAEVRYEAYNARDDLLRGVPLKSVVIPIESLFAGQRPFLMALLNREQLDLLSSLAESGKIQPIARACKFKIGYVSGDKKFFHPDSDIKAFYGLPKENLMKAVVNSRQLRGLGVRLGEDDVQTTLYYPRRLSMNDQSYIEHGEKCGVSNRFKCRTRNPWYVTPGVEIPQLLLTVFAENPLLVINSGGYAASNSLLCGFLHGRATAEDLISRWYNNLTLLSVELQVHSLGGGVLVLIPGETDTINVPAYCDKSVQSIFLHELDNLLRRGRITQAYHLGDELILKRALHLSQRQIDLLRDGVEVLRRWRNVPAQ